MQFLERLHLLKHKTRTVLGVLGVLACLEICVRVCPQLGVNYKYIPIHILTHKEPYLEKKESCIQVSVCLDVENLKMKIILKLQIVSNFRKLKGTNYQ